MSPKKALFFSVFLRIMMVLFCISLSFVKLIESDDETKQGLAEKAKRDLVFSVQSADIKRCKELLAKGVQTNGVLEDGSTPLHLAARNSAGKESYILFKELLYFFADQSISDYRGRLPIHIAVINTKDLDIREKVVGLLLLYGSDINRKNSAKRSCLEDVITLRSISGTRAFMERWGVLCTEKTVEDAKVIAGGQAGKGLGENDQYNELLKKYTIEQCAEKSGIPVLVMKLLKGLESEVIAYLKLHKEANTIGVGVAYDSLPLLHIAILTGKKKVIECIIGSGTVGLKDAYGRTALHILCGSRLPLSEKLRLIDLSVQKGAMFVGDEKKNTPLHVAVRLGDIDLVKELMEKYKYTMYTESRNAEGDRPVDIAMRYGMTEIARMLNG